MLYGGVALIFYVWTALELVRGEAPVTFRESLAAVLGCALIAVFWPIALSARLLLGAADREPTAPAGVLTPEA